ncbi:MAG: leucine-rich repeat protein, partial [Clostridia bacterium]|nr:leucine-rich repeat protein [Clostridia bacterium]
MPEGKSPEVIFEEVENGEENEMETPEETEALSGECGEGLTWKLEDEVLTISGDGRGDDYSEEEPAPWYEYRDQILGLVVEAGVKYIGEYAFMGLENLTEAEISDPETEIAETAFEGCESLEMLICAGEIINLSEETMEEENEPDDEQKDNEDVEQSEDDNNLQCEESEEPEEGNESLSEEVSEELTEDTETEDVTDDSEAEEELTEATGDSTIEESDVESSEEPKITEDSGDEELDDIPEIPAEESEEDTDIKEEDIQSDEKSEEIDETEEEDFIEDDDSETNGETAEEIVDDEGKSEGDDLRPDDETEGEGINADDIGSDGSDNGEPGETEDDVSEKLSSEEKIQAVQEAIENLPSRETMFVLTDEDKYEYFDQVYEAALLYDELTEEEAEGIDTEWLFELMSMFASTYETATHHVRFYALTTAVNGTRVWGDLGRFPQHSMTTSSGDYPAYCLDHLKGAENGTIYTKTSWSSLSYDAQSTITAIVSLGYNTPGTQTANAAVGTARTAVTQLLVWAAETGYIKRGKTTWTWSSTVDSEFATVAANSYNPSEMTSYYNALKTKLTTSLSENDG